MTSEEHLHVSDLHAYRERRLSAADRSTATAHLLRCSECRDQLPLPTPEEFWRAVMGDDEDALNATGGGSVRISAKEFLAGTTVGQVSIRNAVFAGVLAVAVLGFSLFLFMPEGSSENSTLVAAAGNLEPQDSPSNYEDSARPDAGDSSNKDASALSSDSRRIASVTPDPVRSAGTQKISTSQSSETRQPSRPSPLRQAETRGGGTCEEQGVITLEAKKTDAGLLLTWEKVKGAVEYNVYVSDLDERLIDHFTTPGQTSYLVKAELDAEKVYRLRLIATLENGKRIVSESQNIKVSELKNGMQSPGGAGFRKKTAVTVRCAEVKQ